MTEPTVGFIFNQLDDDTLPPVPSDFSVLGIVLPSDDATASVFPLDVAIDVNTGDPAMLAAMGSGPLYKAVLRINNQLVNQQRSARAQIVRVAMAFEADGVTEDVAGTTANIIGDPGKGTGLYALFLAPSRNGATPRIIGAPGYTGWTTFGVMAPVVTLQGQNYSAPVVTFTPPGATATATASPIGTKATAHASLGAGAASGQVAGVTVDAGGSLYTAPPAVTFTGGGIGSNGVTAPTAHAVLTAGVVSSAVVDTAGSGLTGTPTVALAAPVGGGKITAINLTNPGDYQPGQAVAVAITDGNGGVGAGAAATVSLQLLGNPLCAALPAVCNALKAHAVVGGPGTTKADAAAWRGTLNSQKLIPVDNWEIVAAGTGDAYVDGAASTIGCGVRTDFQHEGIPGWSWGNQPVQGLLGLKRLDGLSLLDGATDGQELLAIGVGVTDRGDLGDASLDDSGYILCCFSNASSDPRYSMFNKTRMRDFTDVQIVKSARRRLMADNVTLHGIQAVINDVTAIMSSLPREAVVGWTVGFKADSNTPENLRLGKFRIFDNSEEAAPILQITVDRALDRNALVNELQQIASGTDQVVG